MKILGIQLQYPPTNANYKVEVNAIGVRRRTLDGSTDIHVRAIKKAWRITVPLQDIGGEPLYESMIPYLDGTPFEFEDLDGGDYSVVLVSLMPRGYAVIGEIEIGLEEA